MNLSTRFTVALHILTLIAARRFVLTSEEIADSVNTNPVVVRRLLGLLRKVGIVTSQPGYGGGWTLAVDPGKLTLADVRRAVNEGSPFSMPNHPPNPHCLVGKHIQPMLESIYGKAERAMEAELSRTTIIGLVRTATQRERRK